MATRIFLFLLMILELNFVNARYAPLQGSENDPVLITATKVGPVSGKMRKCALADLRRLLRSEKEWVKVHIAEFLIEQHYSKKEVREVFLQEEDRFGHLPKYRIGVWRVLARVPKNEADRQYWIDKIIAAYENQQGEDRLHAIETLSKLGVGVTKSIPPALTGSFRLYSLWNYALSQPQARQMVRETLISDMINEKISRPEMQVASYILRYMGAFSQAEFKNVFNWLQTKEMDFSFQSSLLATLWMVCPEEADEQAVQAIKKLLFSLRARPEAFNHIMMALSFRGSCKEDEEIIEDFFVSLRDASREQYNSDLHATAAYMVCKACR